MCYGRYLRSTMEEVEEDEEDKSQREMENI